MVNLLSDIRYALRALRVRPGFSFVAVLTLALGIGATTAIFSVVDRLMVRDLPYPDADRVVVLWQNNRRDGIERDDVAPGNYFDWRERSTVFEAIGGADPYSMDLTGDGPPEVMFSVLVTEGFFEAVGIRPLMGRVLQADDFTERRRVVVLSHAVWANRFGGDPGIVGRTLMLDGEPWEVVGVMPAAFELGILQSAGERGVWGPRFLEGWERDTRGSAWWNVVARLKPGVTLARARAELDRIGAQLAQAYPATNADVGITAVPLREHLVGAARPALLTLLGAVTLVLLIACANVANLLLARGAEREGELAVRVAIGAGRGRLVAQLIAESLVLALVGGTAGILLAFWGIDLIKGLAPGHLPGLSSVAVDGRILGFAVMLSGITALTFGLVPAVQGSRPNVQGALREGRGTATRRRQRLRAVLIGGETALAVTLLVGAGLLLRSFSALLHEDPGLAVDHLLAVQLFHYPDEVTAADQATFFRDVVGRIEQVPGVIAAGAVSAGPFLAADLNLERLVSVVGRPARSGEEARVSLTVATPGYFATVGVPLLRGRLFDGRDDRLDVPPVVVINETMQRRVWPGEDPLGARIRFNDTTALEIVGVVGDVLHEGLDAAPRPEVFVPHGQTGYGGMTVFVRTASTPAGLLEAVKRAVWDLDPTQTLYQVATVRQLVADTLAPRRFTMILLVFFAAIALVMAGVGIYGVISFMARQRTHEVGIRIALGAGRAEVIRLIVSHGVRLAGAGLVAGLALSFVGAGVMRSLLYGVASRDLAAFTASALVLLAVAALASYLPARRAAGVDPLEALRHE